MALNYRSKLFGGGPGGGSGVGTSLTTQVLFNSSGSVAGDAGLTYDAATDTLNTGRILAGDGSATVPAFEFSSTPGLGFYSASTFGYGVSGGNQNFAWGGGTFYTAASIVVGGGSINAAASTIRSAAAATLQLGAAPNATPQTNTLIVGESGAGTNIAGANGVISSGIGTGSGTPSSLILSTPDAGGSGAAAQGATPRLSLSQYGIIVGGTMYPTSDESTLLGVSTNKFQSLYLSRATLGSKSKALTDGSATAFASVQISDGIALSGEIIYSIVAVKGTALQKLAGRARFAATREGSTYTVTVNEVGTQALAAAAGTLTGSISAAGAASAITFSANFDTSQSSPDAFVINYRFDSTDAALAITPL